MEFWTRRENKLKYIWDVYDYNDTEPNRPEFEAVASKTKIDPLTQQPTPYEPLSSRICRGLMSWTVIAVFVSQPLLVFNDVANFCQFQIIVVIGTMVSVVCYRTVLNATLFSSGLNDYFVEKGGRLVISLSAALINLIVILILTKVYTWIALKLTEWERHRTQSQFENSFIVKMVIFQFANCYGTIFYTAFIRGR